MILRVIEFSTQNGHLALAGTFRSNPLLKKHTCEPYSPQRCQPRKNNSLKTHIFQVENVWKTTNYRTNLITTTHFFEKKPGTSMCPIGSMYGISTYIYHKNQPNVGVYTIHGSYGCDLFGDINFCSGSQTPMKTLKVWPEEQHPKAKSTLFLKAKIGTEFYLTKHEGIEMLRIENMKT